MRVRFVVLGVSALVRGRVVAASFAVLVGCVTTKDSVGAGDSRLDESTAAEPNERKKSEASCGPDGAGDLVLLDARTGGPLTCLPVTITAEPMSCPASNECPTTTLFRGLTNKQGQVLARSQVTSARVVAVSDGFAPAVAVNITSKPSTVTELELGPVDGYWLKVLDPDGNYLAELPVTFKQGDAVLAQLKTNVLANVFFSQRQPFSGQPVAVEAQGYQTLVINDVSELGDDGHTLVLRR